MKRLLMLVLFILFLPVAVTATDVTLEAEWAYNGPLDEGFRLYNLKPGATEPVILAEIPDGTSRVWTGPVTLEGGTQVFTLVAYGGTSESPHSAPYPFEYIEPDTPGNPPPTLIIRFR